MSKSFLGDLLSIPEIVELDARDSLVRIPPELDVPLTDRVRRLIDTREFRRLGGIPQLGFVSLVYPGAHHTRFEHSLGVYRLALLFLKRLAHDEAFTELVRRDEAELLLVAALFHDIGHWPCCHLIEDMKMDGIVPHESVARRTLFSDPIAGLLRGDWGIDPADVLSLLDHSPTARREGESDADFRRRGKVFRLLRSILSGPVDIDKMDYLFRDSHAAGVPYGRHFDQERLIGSLCLNESRDGLAISEKGKTAAEMMVFARYVMFSEVYWHHAVRAATVMFQRAFEIVFRLAPDTSLFLAEAFDHSAEEWFDLLRRRCLELGDSPSGKGSEDDDNPGAALALLNGVFGPRRRLYKRVRQFGILEDPTIYRRLAGRPRPELRRVVDRVVRRINEEMVRTADQTASVAPERPLSRPLRPNDLLLDAPPVDREIEFAIDVYYPREKKFRPLSDVSPVVRALAQEQYDDCVKKVRLYADPDVAESLRNRRELNDWIADAVTPAIS